MDYLQKILDNSIKNKYLFGVSLGVHQDGKDWFGVSGNFALDDCYFIASTTKLFISTLIFKLRENGNLDFTDTISRHLSGDILNNLHVYKGKEYSNQITIANLLAHTSGIPDYFEMKKPKKTSLKSQLISGNDRCWDVQQAVDWSKKIRPLFEPSKPNKAHYSDTNYQLLGRIIENQYGNGLKEIIQEEICDRLKLSQTYLYADISDNSPKKFYFKNQKLNIPNAMKSFRADGGIVSTSKELKIFLKAFMSGKLFPKAYLKEISQWNKIFFPLESGIGIHRFKAPWYFYPFKRIPELIGHSGLSGAFAFYAPEMNTYLTGTVNQIHNPGNSYRLMLKVLIETMKNSGSQK